MGKSKYYELSQRYVVQLLATLVSSFVKKRTGPGQPHHQPTPTTTAQCADRHSTPPFLLHKSLRGAPPLVY